MAGGREKGTFKSGEGWGHGLGRWETLGHMGGQAAGDTQPCFGEAGWG